MLPGYGESNNFAPSEFAQLLDSLSRPGGYADTTAYGIGHLSPQMIAQAFQQGAAVRDARQRQELAERGQNMEWGKAGLAADAADQTNQLGYAQLGSNQEVARIGQEGKIGAAQARGALNAWQMAQQEKGRNERSSNRIRSQEQIANNRTLDRLSQQGQLKPPTGGQLEQLQLMAMKDPLYAKATPEQQTLYLRKLWAQFGPSMNAEASQGPAAPAQKQETKSVSSYESPAPADYTPIHERIRRAQEAAGPGAGLDQMLP